MKYIEAEKLIAEIERRMTENCELAEKAEAFGQRAVEDNDILTLITSLQQEQPTKGYDEKYLNEKIAKAKKSWEGVDVDKYMDDVRGRKQQEQPEVELELEKEIDKYFAGWSTDTEYGDAVKPDCYGCSLDDCKDIARHFYELARQKYEK